MSNEETTPNFKEMDIAKLRQYAAHLRVTVRKDSTKEDIIKAISNRQRDAQVATFADEVSKLPAGHARIIILEDPMPEAANYPVFVQINGYQCTVPRGREVVVRKRIVEALTNAKTRKRKQVLVSDANGIERFKEVESVVLSYPFTVLEIDPRPEPLTAYELGKLKTIGPRRAYRDLFGRWPRPGEVTRAIEQGLIKLDEAEALQDSEETFAHKSKD